jgi:NADPH:quinone reductase-like Zn-dependent oxidoreductase
LRALGTNAVDVVVDLVGGDQWSKLPDVLKPYGRYAVAGAIAGADVTMDLRTLYLKDQSFFGCTIVDEGVFARVIRLIEEGDVKPVVAAIYPLADITKAQEAFISKAHVGKLVLRIP